jgi:hypothetical protein
MIWVLLWIGITVTYYALISRIRQTLGTKFWRTKCKCSKEFTRSICTDKTFISLTDVAPVLGAAPACLLTSKVHPPLLYEACPIGLFIPGHGHISGAHHHNLSMIVITTRQEDTGTTAMTKAQITEDVVETEVEYLVKDSKHDEEKPYQLAYDAGGIIPQTNMSNKPYPVLIHNFRPFQNSESFSDYGFTSAKIDCALTAAEFENEKTVKDLYYPAIEKLLWQSFPEAAAIRIIEHGVRYLYIASSQFRLMVDPPSCENEIQNFQKLKRSLKPFSLLYKLMLVGVLLYLTVIVCSVANRLLTQLGRSNSSRILQRCAT